MSIKSMGLAWITVSDFNEAVKFYTEVVGLKLMEKNEEWGWAELQGETGACLGIAKACEKSGSKAGQNAVVTFTVEDLDQSKSEMEKKGAVCVGDVCEVPGHVKMQMIRDSDGNQFQIVQILHASV